MIIIKNKNETTILQLFNFLLKFAEKNNKPSGSAEQVPNGVLVQTWRMRSYQFSDDLKKSFFLPIRMQVK